MPEIWLPYGEAEVVINIKAENLGDVLDAEEAALTDDEIDAKLRTVELAETVVHDGSAAAKGLVDRLLQVWGEAGKSVKAVDGSAGGLDGGTAKTSVVVDGSSLRIPGPLSRPGTLLVASTSFDPVFGFAGPHTFALRLSGLVEEAVRRWDSKIASGTESDPGWFAMRYCESISLNAVSVVPARKGVVGLGIGPVKEALASSVEYLNANRKRQVKPSRLVLVGCGGSGWDSTLSAALMTAGNNVGALAEDGELILVAECSAGLGSARMRAQADGSLTPGQPRPYEEAVLKALTAKSRLHLVSTLPKSIVEKRFQMAAHSSLKEAFDGVEARHGWRLKATVLPRAPFIMAVP